MSRIHWIELAGPGRLAIMARPRGDDWLEGEIASWHAAGLHMVVSLPESEEVRELGLQREAELCRDGGIEFVNLPIADRGIPESRQKALRLSELIANTVAEGRSVAVHCRMGIGRSTLVAACGLNRLGLGAEHALSQIEAARGLAVPDTEEQRQWIIAFGEARHS